MILRSWSTEEPIVAAVVAYTVTRKWSMRLTGIAVLMAGMWAAAICWWSHLLLVATIPASMWIARRRSEATGKPHNSRPDDFSDR